MPRSPSARGRSPSPNNNRARSTSPASTRSSDDEDSSFFDFAVIDINPDDPRPTTLADQDINSNEQARQRRELLDLINRLQAIGLGAELELPQIACIGSQSVGKSSLIESISGVALPRATGTCTRCPIECRLKRSDQDWTATVSLRFENGKSGYVGKTKEIEFGKSATNSQLDHSITCCILGAKMTSREEVQDRIRRAQLAILNPTVEHANFLHADTNTQYSSSRSFSQNCVIVVLEGRLISNVADDRNVGDITLVRELVTSYVSKPSCLILLTISCESDFENQPAGRLARDHDPQGLRTIGVLTKPDRIERGSETPWIRMIKNETPALRLRHGWFSVKQPSALELEGGMSWAEGRELDQRFFQDTAPWSTIEDEWRKQLGCSNLISHLGDTLGKVIRSRLPHICDEVDRLIALNASQLEGIPPPPSLDPLAEVLQLVNSFARDVTQHVRGDPRSGRTGLVQSLVTSAKAFQEDLRKITPVFRPTIKGDAGNSPAAPDFLPTWEKWPSHSEKGLTYWLDDVVELAEGARTRELPGMLHILCEFPFAVTEELVTRTLGSWREPVQEMFARAERIFIQRLTTLVETHFGKYSHGGLRVAVQKIVLEQLAEFKAATLQELDFLLEMESLPFTLNSHYYLDYKEKFLKYYAMTRNNRSALARSLRRSPAQTTYPNEEAKTDHLQKAIDSLRRAGFESLRREDLIKLLPADFSQQAALEIMASARAYYQVAYKRFSDTVPLAIDQRYIRGFERAIQTALVAGLKISASDAHDRCARWMAESQATVRRRAELNDRKERLEAARMELMEVPGVLAMRDRLSSAAQDHSRRRARAQSPAQDDSDQDSTRGPRMTANKSTPAPVEEEERSAIYVLDDQAVSILPVVEPEAPMISAPMRPLRAQATAFVSGVTASYPRRTNASPYNYGEI